MHGEILSPAIKEGQHTDYFYDLDTGARPQWPAHIPRDEARFDQKQLADWAAENGVDLMCVTHRAPDGTQTFVLRSFGMKAWEISRRDLRNIDKLIAAGTLPKGHDAGDVCGLGNLENFNPVARIAVEWTRREMQTDNLSYLSSLPAGPLHMKNLTLVHGAFHDEDEYVFVPDQALEGLLAARHAPTFFGHTHIQGGFSYAHGARAATTLKQPRVKVSFAALRVEPGMRYLLNPGSIGQPRDGDPRAAFAIVDSRPTLVEFWRVPYDIAAVQRAHAAGRLARSRLSSRLACRALSREQWLHGDTRRFASDQDGESRSPTGSDYRRRRR